MRFRDWHLWLAWMVAALAFSSWAVPIDRGIFRRNADHAILPEIEGKETALERPMREVLVPADRSPAGESIEEVGSEQHLRVDLTDSYKFHVEEPLRTYVDFWIGVYSRYYSYQGIIHDAKHLDVIYEVLDFEGLDFDEMQHVVSARKERWKNRLFSIHRKQNQPELMTSEEKRIFKLFAKYDEPNKFLKAAHRNQLRFQQGLRDRFEVAIARSGRYLPMMEKAFMKEGLPIELTRLPFVESSFNIEARSKVGASGIWQFIRSTGRLFMRIDDAVDERNDPLLATEAAAKLLRQNYESLRSWPLAVVAYNHGRKGMMSAVRQVGTMDLGEIIEKFQSRTFGFASKNFFFELLAAVEVEREVERFFGKLEREKPVPATEVGVADYIRLTDLCAYTGLDLKTIAQLNPALTDAVFKGEQRIPAGYRLRIPLKWGQASEDPKEFFWKQYIKIPDQMKFNVQLSAGPRNETRALASKRKTQPKGKTHRRPRSRKGRK